MIRNRIFALVGLLWLLSALSSQAAELDLDGDSKSDLIFVSSAGGAYSWQYLSTGDFISAVSLGEIGSSGHLLAPGYWTQRVTPEIGVLSISANKKTVDWTIIDRNGTPRRVSFGGPKDTFVSGGDFNGDGVYGAAVVTKSGAAQIFTNFFAGGITLDLKFSAKIAKKGIPVAIRQNGLNDLLGIVFSQSHGKRKRKKGYTTTLTLIEPNAGQEITTTFSSLIVPVAEVYPVAGGNGVDNIALVSKAGEKKNVDLYTLGGTQVSSRVFDGDGEIIIGNYFDEPGEEIGVYSKGALTIYNPATGFSVTRTGLPSTQVVDHVGLLTFTKSKEKSASVGESKCDVRRRTSDGGGNWLHKPVSDSTGSIVNLFDPSDNPTSCRYENKSGKKFRDAFLSGFSNPDRPTWRPTGGGSCASFPAPLVVSCQVRTKRHCWTIPKPCSRYD